MHQIKISIPPHSLERNTLILGIPKTQIHILQTLRRGPLEQIIDRHANYHSVAARMDSKPADFDAVFAGDGFHERRLAGDFDEFFAGVAFLVEGADVAGCHGLGEGDGDGMLERVERS